MPEGSWLATGGNQSLALGSVNATSTGSCTKVSSTTAAPAEMIAATRQAAMNAPIVVLLFAQSIIGSD
jgi:hypothetical protein